MMKAHPSQGRECVETAQQFADVSCSPLEQRWQQFQSRRFLAMPIAGAIAWGAIGAANALVLESTFARSMAIYIGTGLIFYLGLLVARFTGEDLLGKRDPGNPFDRLFLAGVVQAVTVYSIAIPFALIQPDSLPLSVGILTGLMWIPFSVLLGHWLGVFHTVARTLSCLMLWYGFPDARFFALPLAIVAVYLVTIGLLQRRYVNYRRAGTSKETLSVADISLPVDTHS